MSENKNQGAYFEALGEFVTEYAQVERGLFLALKSTAKLSHSTARVLLSGTRADAATKNISKLLEVRKNSQAVREEFLYVCSQFGHINDIRNLILHYGTEFTDDEEHFTTNALIALTKDRIRHLPVSVKILKDMTEDLFKMRGHLLSLILPVSRIDDRLRNALEQNKQKLWRYRPPQPSSRTSAKSHPNAPRRAHRRKASRK